MARKKKTESKKTESKIEETVEVSEPEEVESIIEEVVEETSIIEEQSVPKSLDEEGFVESENISTSEPVVEMVVDELEYISEPYVEYTRPITVIKSGREKRRRRVLGF